VRPLSAVQLVLYRANGTDVAMELTAPNVSVRDAWVAGLGEAIGRYIPDIKTFILYTHIHTLHNILGMIALNFSFKVSLYSL
jgi:hypothetical protein